MVAPQAVEIVQWGAPPQNAVATVFADLRGQFKFKVYIGSRPNNLSPANPPPLTQLADRLRGDLPLSTIVVMLTDRPLPPLGGGKASPRHGAASVARRVVMASTDGIEIGENQTGPNLVSKMVLHLFAHVLVVGHAPDRVKSLMNDWRDNLGRLRRLPDNYDSRALSRLDRWLRSVTPDGQSPTPAPAAH